VRGEERCWTLNELVENTGICGSTWVNMEGFEREHDNFLNRTTVIDEMLARAYK